LTHRQIHFEPGCLFEREMADVSDHADDAPFAAGAHPLTERILAGPECAGRALINDDDGLDAWQVVFGEVASLDEWNSHGLEIAVADDARVSRWEFPAGIDHAFGACAPTAVAAERKRIGEAGVLDTRDGAGAPQDLVVVNPWYARLSLQRYYRGAAPTITIPPIEPVRWHRFDLVKQAMSSENVVAPVVDAMARTLKAGGRVWVYGGLHFLGRGVEAPKLAPATRSGIWTSYVYDDVWSSQVAQAILPHVTRSEGVAAPSSDPISPLETLPLFVVQGWSESGSAGR